MEKCRRMKRPQFTSKNWIYFWLWKSSRIRQQSYRSESFAMNTDILTNGSMVKNHISLKTGFGYSATRRTSFRSWFLACQRVLPPACLLQHPWHLQGRKLIIPRVPQVHPPHQLRLCPVTVRIEQRQTCVGQIPIQHLCQVHMLNGKNGATRWPSKPKIQKPNKNENHEKERGDQLCSDIPEWLQEFRENLVDDRVPERRDSHASSSHEPSLEPTPTTSANLGVNTVFILTSLKTEIARSVRGPKLQEPRAEDALAEPYLVQKILVN